MDQRQAYIARTRALKRSLSTEEKVQRYSEVYKQARGTTRQAGGMLNQRQAILSYLNKELPAKFEEIIKEYEDIGYSFYGRWQETKEPHYLEYADFLRSRREMFHRYGPDALDFEINEVSDVSKAGVTIETKEEKMNKKTI